MVLGRMLHLKGNTAALISCGTAICGGSAIAAMAPVLRSKDDEIAVALATVFSLNAVALILFPFIGELVGLSQHQFGYWAGMAIHDTSSVVGAAASYGAEALRTGTTVKLTRAAWIAPIAMAAGLWLRSEQTTDSQTCFNRFFDCFRMTKFNSREQVCNLGLQCLFEDFSRS